jgi:small subunit ribosomal protein S15
MSLDQESKASIIEANRIHDTDTGSPEVQVAILTKRIASLTDHLRSHKHDYATQRGLITMIGKRRRHLRYLRNESPERYQRLIKELGIRR